MNNFDLEFLDGYIKSTIRMSKKTLKTSDLNKAKRMADDMEQRAIQKPGESMAEVEEVRIGLPRIIGLDTLIPSHIYLVTIIPID